MTNETEMTTMSDSEYEAYCELQQRKRVEIASALPSLVPLLPMMNDGIIDDLWIDLVQAIDEIEIEQAMSRLMTIAVRRGVCPDCGGLLDGEHAEGCGL